MFPICGAITNHSCENSSPAGDRPQMFIDDLCRTKAKERFEPGQENDEIVHLSRADKDIGNQINWDNSGMIK
jgi:hypothetical protein